MMKTPTFIENHRLVTDVYGYWPSFHDAEIHSILLDRSRILFDAISDARIELVVHCFEMTKTVKEDGFFELIKHHLIHFTFSEVSNVTLTSFNHQNAVYEIKFTQLANSTFKVSISGAHGVDGSFTAQKGDVIAVTPFKP